MRSSVFILFLLVISVALADENSLMRSNVRTDTEQYQLQRMVTGPILHYKNPLRKLYEDPLLNFAAGIAVDYAVEKSNEHSYYNNDVSNLRLIR
jgi:hypothetical protein